MATRGGALIGRTYLEQAIGPDWKRLPPSPVVVLARWGHRKPDGLYRSSPMAIRNVFIGRGDGSVTIRPFRGLRRT